jgi:oligopeptide transport system substrate-binding protein
MKTWKKVSLGTAALLGAVMLAACSNSSTGSSTSSTNYQPLQMNLTAPISTLDSTVVTDAYSMYIIGNTQEGLTRNNNGQPSLALAKSISTSKDGLTVTIDLRSGLKWSNGDPITAQNFVYSWQRAVNPATASQYAYMLPEANIANAAKINGMTAATQADLDTLGVKATSDTQLVVTLSQPTPFFENVLALPVFLPEDPAVVAKYGKQYGTSSDKMVYSGPYYFKPGATGGWTGSNNQVTMVKNPNYWDASAVKSPSATWTVNQNANTAVSLFKSGKLDIAPVATADLYTNYKNNSAFMNLPNSENSYIEFNQSGNGTTTPEVAKALQNVDIRKAISLASDRQGLINAVLPANKPATGFTPYGTGVINGQDFASYAKQGWTYNVKEAQAEWQKGLKALGITSLTLNLTSDSDSPGNVGKLNSDFLQQSLEKALPGLTINEHLVPFQQRLKDAGNANFDLILSLWGGDYSEPSTFLSLFAPGAGNNDGHVNNAAYNAAMKKATSMPDVMSESARYADYKAAEKALYDEASIDPLEFYSMPYLVNPNLKGVVFNATGLSFDIKTAYITK